jgi:hypothetical protein
MCTAVGKARLVESGPMATPPSKPSLGAEIFSAFNRRCRCHVVDESDLSRELENTSYPGWYKAVRESRPYLFSPIAVFVAREDVERMRTIIDAIEHAVSTPAYRDAALARADAIAVFDPGSPGAFLGYDFHLDPDGPKLIEINTNAGGALLNAALACAARECCPEVNPMSIGSADPAQLQNVFIETLRREWRAQRGGAVLRGVAIVDDEPNAQYLYPEFQLFETLLRRDGIDAVIADAASLRLDRERLYVGEHPIDLVYNRLTDFALAEPHHAALREAYLQRRTVVTPHPRAYALYADKRNLTVLTDPAFQRSLPQDIAATLLNGIPRTVAVAADQADVFWTERKRWFFKPATGFGSRAAYRGDKLTRRVFEEILKGGYVAQTRIDPAERAHMEAQAPPFKFDLRCYVYDGEVQLLAARLYHGQTTNFRTPGGGFAPVFYGM